MPSHDTSGYFRNPKLKNVYEKVSHSPIHMLYESKHNLAIAQYIYLPIADLLGEKLWHMKAEARAKDP